ncbi:MAG: Fic family protein [Alphaproteobacteria bacterium]|nr:Fic family protein [Alphaproteobacteria bacterium]
MSPTPCTVRSVSHRETSAHAISIWREKQNKGQGAAGVRCILVRAALAHVQFETTHPFLDGNGRVARLLITLLLYGAGILKQPLLYLSLFFNEHRAMYYELLNRVRLDGDWESWLAFFLEGVRVTAEAAVSTADRLSALFGEDRGRLAQGGGRRLGSALRMHEALKARPILSLPVACKDTGLSFQAAASAMETLTHGGIAREITGNAAAGSSPTMPTCRSSAKARTLPEPATYNPATPPGAPGIATLHRGSGHEPEGIRPDRADRHRHRGRPRHRERHRADPRRRRRRCRGNGCPAGNRADERGDPRTRPPQPGDSHRRAPDGTGRRHGRGDGRRVRQGRHPGVQRRDRH